MVFGDYARTVEPGEDPPTWHEVECGRVELSDFVVQMQKTFLSELPPDHQATTMTADDFDPFADAEPIAPMLELAEEIQASGIRTAILTNNVKEWGQWRDLLPLQSFDSVVDSCQVGMRKPDPDIYVFVCNQLGLAPKDCLFLDDHPDNIRGALAVGLDALLVSEDFEAAVVEVRSRL